MQSSLDSLDMSGEISKCLAKQSSIAGQNVRRCDKMCKCPMRKSKFPLISQKLVGHFYFINVWQVTKMSSEGLPVRRTKCPARAQKTSCTLKHMKSKYQILLCITNMTQLGPPGPQFSNALFPYHFDCNNYDLTAWRYIPLALNTGLVRQFSIEYRLSLIVQEHYNLKISKYYKILLLEQLYYM